MINEEKITPQVKFCLLLLDIKYRSLDPDRVIIRRSISKRTLEIESGRYRRWRNAVLKRDNYTCQWCKTIEKPMRVHHILMWSKYPKKRYKLNNGITLCIDCHKDVTGEEYRFELIFKGIAEANKICQK